MVTDKQVRILMKLINQEKTPLTAAAKAGMCKMFTVSKNGTG